MFSNVEATVGIDAEDELTVARLSKFAVGNQLGMRQLPDGPWNTKVTFSFDGLTIDEAIVRLVMLKAASSGATVGEALEQVKVEVGRGADLDETV